MAGVFVRDVNANANFSDTSAAAAGVIVPAIDDPTGSQALESRNRTPVSEGPSTPTESLSPRPLPSRKPTRPLGITLSDPSNGYFTSVPSPLSAEPENYDTSPPAMPPLPRRQTMPYSIKRQNTTSDPERKRQELQNRVWAARLRMPENVLLRVFRSPEECVEAKEILDHLLNDQLSPSRSSISPSYPSSIN